MAKLLNNESKINKINEDINKITDENNSLERDLIRLKNNNNAAHGEYKQKHYIYNQLFLENIILASTLSTIIFLYIYKKV